MAKLTRSELALITHYGWELRLERVLDATVAYQNKVRDLHEVQSMIVELEGVVVDAQNLPDELGQKEKLVEIAEQQLQAELVKERGAIAGMQRQSEDFYKKIGHDAALALMEPMDEADWKMNREQMQAALEIGVRVGHDGTAAT